MPNQTFFNLPKNKHVAVMNAAIDEFSENDYETASIASIVSKSGIARGSFYQYFENKEDLYSYLLELVLKERLSYIIEKQKAEKTNIYNIQNLLEQGIKYDYNNPKYSKIFNRAMFGNRSVRELAVKRIKEATFAYIHQIISYGVRDGYFRSEIDINLVTYILNFLMSDIINYINDYKLIDTADEDTEVNEVKLKELFTKMTDILHYGLKKI